MASRTGDAYGPRLSRTTRGWDGAGVSRTGRRYPGVVVGARPVPRARRADPPRSRCPQHAPSSAPGRGPYPPVGDHIRARQRQRGLTATGGMMIAPQHGRSRSRALARSGAGEVGRGLALHERSGARVPERSGPRTERARVHAVHVMGGVTRLGPMRRPTDDRLSGRRRLRHAHPRAWALRRHRHLRRFHAGQSGRGRRGGAGGDRRRTAVAQSANALWTKSREVEIRHGLPSPGHEPAKGSRRCSAVPVGDQTS
jgi:hypothetical protein